MPFLSPLTLRVRILVSASNKTDLHDITEILLKVPFNTMTIILTIFSFFKTTSINNVVIMDDICIRMCHYTTDKQCSLQQIQVRGMYLGPFLYMDTWCVVFQSLVISPIFRDFCHIIVRKGAISFVISLSQCFSSSDPATFQEFKFNSKLTTPLHVVVISGILGNLDKYLSNFISSCIY